MYEVTTYWKYIFKIIIMDIKKNLAQYVIFCAICDHVFKYWNKILFNYYFYSNSFQLLILLFEIHNVGNNSNYVGEPRTIPAIQ